MMDLPWNDIVTIYGPLGLGWPMFIWLQLRFFKYLDKQADADKALASALAALTARIEGGRG